MPGQFDLQNNFPVASVANLYADRPMKEAQLKQQQLQDLTQGLSAFNQGVQSLVQKRNQMAQALTLGKNLGMAPEEVQGLTPDQVMQAAVVKKGNVDMNMLMTLLHPNSTTPNAGTTVSGPAGETPVASTGGPILTSNTTSTPVSDASTGQSGNSVTPTPPSVPVPMMAPPIRPNQVNGATAKMAMHMADQMRPIPVMTQADALAAGSIPNKTKVVPNPAGPGGQKQDNEYDKLEGQVINRIVGIRGDKSLARTEEQRDASIQAYNTIQQIKTEKRLPNQLEYYDILGQMWKARTGSSPTEQSIRDLDAKTFQGDLGKAYQYFSGTAAPRTTEGVMDAIQNFAKQSGQQADKLHDGYMQSHLVKPKNMSQSDFDNIMKANRGLSFKEATQQSDNAAPSAGQSPAWSQDKEQRLQMLLEKQKNGSLGS